MLAPSAFLASAASTHDLQQSILPEPTRSRGDDSISIAETRWMSLSRNSTPATESVHIQRAWDSIVCKKHEQLVWSHASTDIDKAILLAALQHHHTQVIG